MYKNNNINYHSELNINHNTVMTYTCLFGSVLYNNIQSFPRTNQKVKIKH